MTQFVVYKLRRALRKMYEGYPTHSFFGYLERDIKFKTGIVNLEQDGLIKRTAKNDEGNESYRLTAEGLRLVESWNVNTLTNIIIILTIGLFFIGIAQFILIYLRNPIFK